MSHKKSPKESQNRYLNLAGATWSPEKPDRVLSMGGYFAVAAMVGVIHLGAIFNSKVEQNEASYLGAGLSGAALSIGLCSFVRRRIEAPEISSNHDCLVIDTSPDPGSPPTSPDMLRQVGSYERLYQLSLANYAPLMGVTTGSIYKFFNGNSEVGSLFVAGIILSLMLEHAFRYRQLHKITQGNWVITDQGSAIGKFQEEARGYLLNNPDSAPIQVPK